MSITILQEVTTVELTPEEEWIIDQTRKTGNINLFSEHFFRTPICGTWLSFQDHVERFDMTYAVWKSMGMPEPTFQVSMDGIPTEVQVIWDREYYGDYPLFLIPHGYRFLPWMYDSGLLSLQVTKAVAETGTGTGKTSGVTMAALTYCAIYPGFDFLNVTASQAQADLMLNEVVKWAGHDGSPYKKFIQKTRGANNLWVERPYPTIKINLYGIDSTFVCQTLTRRTMYSHTGANLLGGERDFICVDESQLVPEVEHVKNQLTTRLRGSRKSGLPRTSKEMWITNPGENTGFYILMDQYKKLAEEDDSVVVLTDIHSDANIYLTQRQLAEQRKVMSEREQARWLGGSAAAVERSQDIGSHLVEKCRDNELTSVVEAIGIYDSGVDLIEYELPYHPDRHYVAVGDVGKSHLVGLHSMNVPCVMVLDVTDFLERPIEMAAFYWIDGKGSYTFFAEKMRRAMREYRCVGYYDATHIQTAFEDFPSVLQKLPSTPLTFAGSPFWKKWAIATLVQMLDDQMFAFPYCKGLWHQADIYQGSSKKIPDDIIATLLVFCLALRYEDIFYNKLVNRYTWELEQEEEPADGGESLPPYQESDIIQDLPSQDPHARIFIE